MSALTRKRCGFSLVELVVVLILAGLVASAIAITIVRQQRFYRGAAELGYARESVRDAMEILSMDIRAMSLADSGLLRADSAVEFLASVGVSVVCQSAATEVGLPPVHSSGNSLSSFLLEPDTGDLAVFQIVPAANVIRWEWHRISGFASRSLASSCPPESGFTGQADLDVGRNGFVVTLATPLGPEVRRGASVHFLRRGRYSLYRAGGGGWYLGYRRCSATGVRECAAIQPVSGPYRPYSRDPRATGLLFEYFDAAGLPLGPSAPTRLLARVDITARSASTHPVPLGERWKSLSDSGTISVAIRNGP